jgi:exodeoxyribonuclease VII large subunit
MQNACVEGEVSNCTYHKSGHIYFTLKDAKSQLKAVMFSGNRRGLHTQMKDGDKVQVRGRIEVYKPYGNYQIIATSIEPAGQGLLYQEFERLKAELLEMGMFDDMYKKPIPKYIRRLGVITAPGGAAVRDIIQISKRRNPYIEIVLYPALVQGEGAVESIVHGIQVMDQMGMDTLIVGRGGGSIEDLWAFNEREVAQAIFQCETPVISAVGHETDVTIADFVSDLRAPTPSAAAELAVFDYQDLLSILQGFEERVQRRMEVKIEMTRQRADHVARAIRLLSPENKGKERRVKLLELERKMQVAMERKLEDRKKRAALLAGRLEGSSPVKRLAAGYSYLEKDGQNITKASQVKMDDKMHIYLSEGELDVKVIGIAEESPWQKKIK